MKKSVFTAKLVNLCSALNACGVPAQLVEDEECGLMLTSALWNCQDGSAVRFELCQDPGAEEGVILAYAQTLEDVSYEELLEEEFE